MKAGSRAGWRRVALALAAGALATMLSAAGCTTAATTPPISGNRLAVYVSDPPGLTADQQDVVDAERLAFSQLGGQLGGGRKVSLHVLSDAKLSENARRAIVDNDAIAYLGEVAPGASADTIGITNALDVLQVSPTDSTAALTSSTRYYENFSTYGHTFARMVPSAQAEAHALVSEMTGLGVKRLYIETDGGLYGRGLMSAVRADMGSGIAAASTAAGADAVLYAGSSAGRAAAPLGNAAATHPHLRLFVGSALADHAFAAMLPPSAQSQLYAIAPGFLPARLTSTQRAFVAAFRSAYGHPPATEAIFGYAAMQAVLHVLGQAGSQAASRSTVEHDFMKLDYSDSVLGPYRIDRRGDTSLTGFVIERVKHGRLAPVQAR